MRIGVHTGPVLAGVIGKKKFIYDVFDFESRGTIAVKGKGDMQTYLLLRRKAVVSERSAELPSEPPTAGSSTAGS